MNGLETIVQPHHGERTVHLPTANLVDRLMEMLYRLDLFDYEQIDLFNVLVNVLPDNINQFPDSRAYHITRFLHMLAYPPENEEKILSYMLEFVAGIEQILWTNKIIINSNNETRLLGVLSKDLIIGIKG